MILSVVPEKQKQTEKAVYIRDDEISMHGGKK